MSCQQPLFRRLRVPQLLRWEDGNAYMEKWPDNILSMRRRTEDECSQMYSSEPQSCKSIINDLNGNVHSGSGLVSMSKTLFHYQRVVSAVNSFFLSRLVFPGTFFCLTVASWGAKCVFFLQMTSGDLSVTQCLSSFLTFLKQNFFPPLFFSSSSLCKNGLHHVSLHDSWKLWNTETGTWGSFTLWWKLTDLREINLQLSIKNSGAAAAATTQSECDMDWRLLVFPASLKLMLKTLLYFKTHFTIRSTSCCLIVRLLLGYWLQNLPSYPCVLFLYRHKFMTHLRLHARQIEIKTFR